MKLSLLKKSLLLACGLLISTHALARTMVYISNAGDGEIAVYELHANSGDLSLQQTIAAGETVMPLTISPDRKTLYASIRSEPYSVATFSIQQKSGLLHPLSLTALPDNMCFLLVDSAQKNILSASYQGSKIAINKLNAKGVVLEKNAHIYPTGLRAHALLFDASNRFLFITNLGSDQILQMKYDPDAGTITPNEPATIKTQPGAGPRHLRFSPDYKFVYVLNELNGTVTVYEFDKNKGVLHEKQTVLMAAHSFKGNPSAAEIQITPNGKYVYTSERSGNTLALFKRNEENGHLTYIESIVTEARPRGFTISPDGHFLLVAGKDSSHVSVYNINDATGQLNFLKRYAVGSNPNWIEIIELN